MPKNRFKWDSVPPPLLKALSRDLGVEGSTDLAGALRATYGARPTKDFIRDAWPTLRETWLRTSRDSRDWIVSELRTARREGGPITGRDAQMGYLRSLTRSKNLIDIVWDEFVTLGEAAPPEMGNSLGPKQFQPLEAVSDPLTMRGQHLSLTELEARLWAAANALRGPVDPADFKTYVFPMLFWKWISDNWDSEHALAVADFGEELSDEIEADYHRFSMPADCRWTEVTTKTDNLGSRVGRALGRLEQANPKTLAGIFGDAAWGNKDRLPETALVSLVNAFNGLILNPANVSHDMLGQAYEYLLKQFADASGKKAGEFFTPRQVVHLLVGILDPQPGDAICDPASGSGGMLVETINSVRDRGHDHRTLRLYAQEVNLTTAAIARMNLFLHEIEDFRVVRGDTLRSPGLRTQDGSLQRFEVVIANPPFSLQNWGAELWPADGRSFCGVPPAKNGDYAWIQHMVTTMAPGTGRVGVVMPHGVLFRGGSEAKIRQCLVEGDLLEAVIGLPPNLFYSTTIPACILVFQAAKPAPRKNHVLLIDGSARFSKGKNQNYMTDIDMDSILAAYRTGEDPDGAGGIEVRLVPVDEIAANSFDLTLGRYLRASADDSADIDAALHAYALARAGRTQAETLMLERLAAAGIEVPDV